MTRRPVAYLRKSRISTDHHLSWEMQESEIRAMAERHGANGDLVILSDWGKSGRGAKLRLRKGYAELLSMVESDQVSALFGYSMSRLSRSLGDYVKLAELCRDHGVPIHLAKEGTLDYSTASGRLLVNLLASVAQAEADWGSERATDAMRVRQARGEHVGQVGYGYRLVDGKVERNPAEPTDVVINAFREAGSYNGAAKILNESGVKGRGRLWSMTGVRAVVRREAPELARHGQGRVRTVLNHRFGQLIRCHCGSMLTAIKNQKGYTSYMCWTGYRDPRHRRPYMVSEGKLRPWIEAEAARLRLPFDQVTMGTQNAARRGELMAQRERLGLDVVAGLLGPEKVAAMAAELESELEQLDDQEQLATLPPAIDWSKEPASVNGVLRSMWRYVQLDEQMKPVAAEWIRPEWRRP